jgi:undecaprenyl-diphosphatase
MIFGIINSDLSSPILNAVLIPLRHKFFWIPLYLFLISFITFNFKREKWLIFLFIGITIGFSDFSSSKLIKNNVQRIRPCNTEKLHSINRIPCSNGYSFTSSHATNHFALSIFLFLLFPFWKHRWLFVFWASLIGYAQIYVGAHYPLDIIAGSILGATIGYLTFLLFNKTRQRFLPE